MPRINITPQLLAKRNPVETNWYRLKVTEVKEEINKDKSATNVIVELDFVPEPGKTLPEHLQDRSFEKVFWSATGKGANFILDFLEQVYDKPAKDLTDGEAEVNNAIGREVFGMIEKTIQKRNENDRGYPANKCEQWHTVNKPPF